MTWTGKAAGGAAAAGAAEAARLNARRWWGLAVVALSQLMITLDTTVVTVALPSAQRDLGLSGAGRQWVVTAYTLTFGGLLLLGGRIADRVGRKRALIAGVVGFAVVSGLGGIAGSGWMLIGARAGQGVFAALLAPSTLALLVAMFPEQAERARAIGIYTAVLTAGGGLGLVGGGLITSYLDWRWCMYVNIPIALLAAFGAISALPDPPGRADAKTDVLGAVTGCGGIAALVHGFSEAGERGWGADRVAVPLGLAAVLLIAFVLLQARLRSPLLPLRIVTDRNRGTAFATVALATLGLFGVFLFLTYQLQTVMDYSAVKTGVALLPLVAMNVTGATQISSRLLPELPPRLLIVPGLLAAAASLALLTRLTPDSSYTAVILPAEMLLGLGIGTLFVPIVAVATGGVDPQDGGVASATVNTAQQVGASIGTALLNTIAAGATAAHLNGHPGSLREATVHGYSVAATWALGIMLGTALLVAVFIDADPRKPAAHKTPHRPSDALAEK
ncbi:MFS transporter [Streptomyces populi]